ncbi:MAG: pheS [Bacteroidetes bacterium]|nr:pheS [Bacteroidota bacterium]
MLDTINTLRQQAEQDLAAAHDRSALEAFRVTYLARKGKIAELFDALRTVPAEQRPAIGKHLNALRAGIQELFDQKLARTAEVAPRAPSLDLTLPGRRPSVGSRHLLTQTMDEIKAVFVSMGFGIADGPEIEDDYHNFGALNFPPDHPARDMQDTFFLDRTALLRTHTSPVQIRVMKEYPPPERDPDFVYQTVLRQLDEVPVPADLLPVHGTQRGYLHLLLPLRRQRMQAVQTDRLAGDPRLRHGRPECLHVSGIRPGTIYRLCVRDGHRTDCAPEARHR